MDKFGIFNLLNSFFSLVGTQKDDNSQSATGDLVKNLLSSLKNKAPENKQESIKKSTQPPHPLQENMLSTISSHDALIKRVNLAQSKNNIDKYVITKLE